MYQIFSGKIHSIPYEMPLLFPYCIFKTRETTNMQFSSFVCFYHNQTLNPSPHGHKVLTKKTIYTMWMSLNPLIYQEKGVKIIKQKGFTL